MVKVSALHIVLRVIFMDCDDYIFSINDLEFSSDPDGSIHPKIRGGSLPPRGRL